MARAPRCRSWNVVINNPTPEDWDDCIELDCRYYIWAQEVAPDTDTDHIQGFMMFEHAKTMETVKDLLPRAHLEAVTETPHKAAHYCKKDGLYTEFGDPPKDPDAQGPQGKKSGKAYEQAYELAKQGKFSEINKGIYIRCRRNLHSIYQESKPAATTMSEMDFHWFWGETGTGKSRTARAENPDHYIKNLNKWWCNYEGQACVIIEEWHPDMVSALQHYLKQWCDHYPFHAETKGSSMMIRPKKIIITSNYSLEECFPDPKVGPTLMRRFKERHFGSGEVAEAASATQELAGLYTGYDASMELENMPSPDVYPSPTSVSPSPNPGWETPPPL